MVLKCKVLRNQATPAKILQREPYLLVASLLNLFYLLLVVAPCDYIRFFTQQFPIAITGLFFVYFAQTSGFCATRNFMFPFLLSGRKCCVEMLAGIVEIRCKSEIETLNTAEIGFTDEKCLLWTAVWSNTIRAWYSTYLFIKSLCYSNYSFSKIYCWLFIFCVF